MVGKWEVRQEGLPCGHLESSAAEEMGDSMEQASVTHLRDEGARVFIFQLLLVRGVEDRFQRALIPPPS